MSQLIDLIGQKYGNLTVIGRAPNRGKHVYWQCKCDFAIFKDNKLSHLIEFDGRQHSSNYIPWNSNETLEERQLRDKMKDDYCLKNNIKLIRIPYEKRDNITLHDLGVEI